MARRICVVRQNYFPEEAHVRKNVDALVDAGFQVDVICLRDAGEPARDDYRGGRVYRLPLRHKRGGRLRYLFEYAAFFLMALGVLTALSLRRRYAVVEVYSIPDFLVFAALPARLRRARVVLYLFEMMPEQVRHEYGLAPSHPLYRLALWLERRAVRFADRVITVSPHQREVVRERSGPRTEPALVLNVPDEALFAPRPVARGDAFRIMTHGSLLRRYGIQTLIRAVPLLRDEIPNVEVWIVGDGEYREPLAALARELGVEANVRFVGWVPIERVPGYIAQADVCLVPVSAPWLLPNKLFEYAAMGKPVVASATPALQAVFDADAVAYFRADDERDLAQHILELYRDPARAARMAAAARAVYQRSAWSAMKADYVGVHQALLTCPGGTPRRGENHAHRDDQPAV
ncbi:MAG TPA: glycosyltransferase family 4 protein [Dehalococcoidia bacterium]